MSFLENCGLEEGCLNCRYMSVLDKKIGESLNKTFGLILDKKVDKQSL
ncbi:hypothetical protein JKI98_11570 [Acinetobacter nectaris]|nr:hypothetical protein [Acinetobacter nectaris]